jgi:hypothetical protein
MLLARKVWRTLEPFHGMVYFAPESSSAFSGFSLTDPTTGYFASRSAAMGPVPAEVVIATFFNFHPDLVRRAMAGAWTAASPADWLAARLSAVDGALRRMIGDAVGSAEMTEAAGLARTAVEACTDPGRPLAAAHRALPWPDAPHVALWQAITVLREFRGDGHIAALVVEGLSGVEALVQHAATGDVPRAALQSTRAWSDDEWNAAVSSLAARRLVKHDGSFTDAGRAQRDWIEDRTDQLAAAPFDHLGSDGCDRLRELVRPWSRAIVDAGTLGMMRQR